MVNEEYILKLAEFEREIAGLQQQMQIIEQQILELRILQNSLQELERSKEKQMLANLGKGIFIKTEIQDKNLFVDVGNKTFVTKKIKDTLVIVEQELSKLMEAKNKVLGKMQGIQIEAEKIFGGAGK